MLGLRLRSPLLLHWRGCALLLLRSHSLLLRLWLRPLLLRCPLDLLLLRPLLLHLLLWLDPLLLRSLRLWLARHTLLVQLLVALDLL